MDEIYKKIEDYIALIDCSRRKIELDITEIAKYDSALADYIIDNFAAILPEIEYMAKERHKTITDNDEEVYVYFTPSKLIESLEWADAHAKYNGKLRKIWGTVTSIMPTEYFREYFYKCEVCHKKFTSFMLKKKCIYCGMEVLKTEREKINCYRDIMLLEQKEDSLSQENIKCRISLPDNKEYGLVDFYNLLGYKIEVAGYLEDDIKQRKRFGKEVNTFRFVIKGIRIKEVMKLTDDDKAKCRKFILEHRHDLLDILCNEIWYGTHGYENERKLILLHALGLNKIDDDLDMNTKQMVLMIVSDKGMNKSKMADAILKYFPDGGKIMMTNQSQAGIILGIQKAPNGEYITTLGEIPACNNSICVCDEIDKMREEDYNALLSILSDAFIKTSKIKKFQMKCHINFIFLANPKRATFDPELSYFNQLDMPPVFLDRMDTIILLLKSYDDNTKIDFAEKVLNPKKRFKRTISELFLKKILYYIKRFALNPKSTDEAEFIIIKRWDWLQKKTESADKFKVGDKTVEARALVSMLKFCKAYGRALLYEKLTADITQQALDLYQKGALQNWWDTYGIANPQETLGDAQTQSSRIRIPDNDDERKQYILNILEASKDGMDIDNLISQIKNKIGLPTTKIQKLIEALLKGDEISEIRGIIKRKWNKGVDEEFIDDVADVFNINDWISKKLEEKEMTDIEIVELAKKELNMEDDFIFKAVENLMKNGTIMQIKDGKLKLV